jgi:hypothetical protein
MRSFRGQPQLSDSFAGSAGVDRQRVDRVLHQLASAW